MKENLQARNISVYYGPNKALHEVSLDFVPGRVSAWRSTAKSSKNTAKPNKFPHTKSAGLSEKKVRRKPAFSTG